MRAHKLADGAVDPVPAEFKERGHRLRRSGPCPHESLEVVDGFPQRGDLPLQGPGLGLLCGKLPPQAFHRPDEFGHALVLGYPLGGELALPGLDLPVQAVHLPGELFHLLPGTLGLGLRPLQRLA